MENPILRLFESPGPLETPTPGASAWLARDPAAGRPVLIKRLPGTASKARATDALGLDHPNIVRTRRWMVYERDLWIVRDVARGKNLRQHLISLGKRPETETLRALMNPVIDALEYAHGRGAPHGGISYENILVTDEQVVQICDFGATDPAAPSHQIIYDGRASEEGDVRAVGKMIAALLPVTGAFANPVVRSRIEGVALRCDTLADLRATLAALDNLATAPLPRTVPVAATPAGAPGIPPPLFGEAPRTISPPQTVQAGPAPNRGTPHLECEQLDRPVIAQGGGGLVPVEVRNTGDVTLLVRMIASQHPWVNPRPMALPLVVPPGGSTRIAFVVSAARLAPGEYRSEIYLSTNAVGPQAEDLRTGWYKHTFEIRARIGSSGARW